MEQGLALGDLVETKTSIERGAQGEPLGDRSATTEGAAGTAAVSPSSDHSDGEGLAASREGGIPAEAGEYRSSAPRYVYNRERPRRAQRRGIFKSHGVAVCTQRQHQRQQQQQQQQVEKKEDLGVIRNEGGNVCTFRDKTRGRQPCEPYRRCCLVGQSHAAYRSRPVAEKLAVAENGGGLIVGCLQQYQQRWSGNKSSGMTARTP